MAQSSDPASGAGSARSAAPASGAGEAAGPARSLWGWLDDRLRLSALRYKVPEHANTIWYTLGGITFMGILVLAATGIWLAQYYDPDPAAARQSEEEKSI